MLLAGSSIVAQTIETPTPHPDSEERLRMPLDQNYPPRSRVEPEGILGGLFPNIHGNDALHLDYVYTGGVFNNSRGGAQTSHSTRYVGIFDLGITANTEKLGLWKHGTFYTHALFSHGRNPSEYVGDWQGVAVFAYETPVQVSEYWYEHHLFQKNAAIRVGKIDAGVDFFYLNATQNFLNASGTCVPTTGIPTAPANTWGIMSSINLSNNLCFKFGLFDADGNANKFWMSQSGNIYTAYQFDVHYNLFRHLPGFAYIGAWYDNSENISYKNNTHFGKSGYSVGFEQMIYRRNYLNEDDRRGLTFFAQFSQPQTDRANDLFRFWALGFRWLGIFENRPDDVLGFGIFSAGFDRSRRTNDLLYAAETTYEIHYHVHITENVVVQPTLQYIVHPSGINRNALVPGLIFQITF
jgi:porin